MVAVLVGYTSSVAIVFQAAHAAGATPAEIGSWLWALGIGMGVTCMGLSWWTRAPILTAWSTPGAALLATSLQGLTMPEAVGVFCATSALIAITGWLGVFDRLMKHVPASLAAAMLAGVLLKFCVQAFVGLQANGPLVLAMLVTYVLARKFMARYAVPLTLMVGLASAWASDQFKIKNTLLLAVVTSIFSVLVFVKGLGLPFAIIGPWFGR